MKRTLSFMAALLSLLLVSGSVAAQSDLGTIQSYFTTHLSELHVQPADVATLEIVSEASSNAKGVKHVYIRQLINGLPVSNGLATVTLKDGKVVRVANRLKGNLVPVASQPVLDAKAAVETVATQLGIAHSGDLTLLKEDKIAQSYVFAKGDLAREDIPIRLVYTVSTTNMLQLAWDLSLATRTGDNWWSIRVSAMDGTILEQNDWVVKCAIDDCRETTHRHQDFPILEQQALLPPPPPGADQYRVYALPVESPNHGNRSVVINPSDPIASPFGWHDVNGIAGDEFTITRGNNVYASDDIDDDDEPGYSPTGGTSLNFDFGYDSSAGVQGNLDAVITNLFYMNNMMHDIWHYYGFDEASGNFQQRNYTGDGEGEDFVFADAQDGSGSNNANFSTPPDGFNPRMQMYLWTNNAVEDMLTVNSPSGVAGNYTCAPAGFGPPIPSTPITADFVVVNDGTDDTMDGCETILNGSELVGKIALVRRGNCNFEPKVIACQNEGAVAVIVINNTNSAIIPMGGGGGGAMVPSVMISQADGAILLNAINGGAVLNGTLVSPADLTATDSDLDNMIIAHEYGHGISTRLTGGASNSDCLFNEDQMGEGWSDWFGLMLTMEPGDVAADRRGVGTYVTNQAVTGTGIRNAPYSTSFSINNYTYASTNNTSAISEPHGIGFVWATMLWDLNWALIDEYGFDPNLKTGTGGNNKAMALVIEGLKLQPCNPGFADGRDAILAADQLLYDGANYCLIWKTFAKRGLGLYADQGSPYDRTDQVQAFNLPTDCTLGMEEKGLEQVAIYPNPTKDLLHIDMSGYDKVQAIRVLDLQGKVLFETTAIASSLVTVDLSSFRSGLYLVQLTDVNGAKAVEVVKH